MRNRTSPAGPTPTPTRGGKTRYPTVTRDSAHLVMEKVQPFSFRVTDEEAAERAGLNVSEWERLVLNSAAGVSKLDEQLAGRIVFYIDVGKLTPKEAERVMG